MAECTVTFPQELLIREELDEFVEEYSVDQLLGDVDGKTYTLVFERESPKDAFLSLCVAVDALDDLVLGA